MPSVSKLQAALAALDPQSQVGSQLRSLIQQGLDALPLPGAGATLQRWQALASVAAHDLSLAKLYEGHTDALAILAELGQATQRSAGSVWGTWAAESPAGRALLTPQPDGRLTVSGAKFWCSGAGGVSHGLLTAWAADGQGPQLVSLAMDQPAIELRPGAWQAVGMAGSTSIDLILNGAAVTPVGKPGDYLSRKGFWQGGAGIAACWYGAAQSLGETLREAVLGTPADQRHPFRLAALGKVDLRLQESAAVLRNAAAWIDSNPRTSAQEVATRARLSAEVCATAVLHEVGRSLGAAPFCRNAKFARMAADLPVFIRQSHAERDFAALGEHAAASVGAAWSL